VNKWDERYSRSDYIFGTEPNDFLAEVCKDISQGRVLCLADGEGRNGVFLAQQGLEVESVDGSVVALEKARRLAAERTVSLTTHHADLADFDLGDEAWGGIVSIYVHLPLELRTSLHARVVKALKPGGVFILEAYTPKQLEYRTGGPSTPELLMTLAELKEELAGLEFKHARELERTVNEGPFHSGHAAVVQIVAIKP